MRVPIVVVERLAGRRWGFCWKVEIALLVAKRIFAGGVEGLNIK